MRFRLSTLLLTPFSISPLLLAFSVAWSLGYRFDPAVAFAGCAIYSFVFAFNAAYRRRGPSLRRSLFSGFAVGSISGVFFAAQLCIVASISMAQKEGLIETVVFVAGLFLFLSVTFGVTGSLAGMIAGLFVAVHQQALRDAAFADSQITISKEE